MSDRGASARRAGAGPERAETDHEDGSHSDGSLPGGNHPEGRAATGIAGLDEILHGGLPRDRLYLIEGEPGSGKTTLGLRFLLEGVRRGERALLVNHAETPKELEAIARVHGWSLAGLEIWSWPGVRGDAEPASYTLFHALEVELSDAMGQLLREVEALRPSRLVFDSIAGLRLLSADPIVYRRQLQALRDRLADRACTSILIDDSDAHQGGSPERSARTLVHGVIRLEQITREYGGERRQLRVVKIRGATYASGLHDFSIRRGGLEVYPRLVARGDSGAIESEPISSGNDALDALLGGGPLRGTSTLLIGPAGTGKSSLSALYAAAAARRGERSILFLFDEEPELYVRRAEGLGIPLSEAVANDRVRLARIDAASLSPGAFTQAIRREIEGGETRFVVIDSVNGYLHGMSEEPWALLHLRELLSFLSRRGIATFLVVTQHGLLGEAIDAPIDVSFLADSVVLLRFFESHGAVHKSISVVKKRDGRHERTIRELRIDSDGIAIGEPLAGFTGVLGGRPVFTGTHSDLMKADRG